MASIATAGKHRNLHQRFYCLSQKYEHPYDAKHVKRESKCYGDVDVDGSDDGHDETTDVLFKVA
jgi:hypothetical protein